MTCVVGLVQDGAVLMGADSVACGGDDLQGRRDSKIFRTGQFLFGVAGSFRANQIIRYKFTPPKMSAKADVHRYMAVDFTDALRDALMGAGHAAKENNAESFNAEMLVAVKGALFFVDGDYQVGMLEDSYAAIGAGAAWALGSLYTSSGEPIARVRRALEAAERYCSSVRRPWVVETL